MFPIKSWSSMPKTFLKYLNPCGLYEVSFMWGQRSDFRNFLNSGNFVSRGQINVEIFNPVEFFWDYFPRLFQINSW